MTPCGSKAIGEVLATSPFTDVIPCFIPQTKPTRPDQADTTGECFFQIRMNPTSPDQFDRLQPPHHPSVVGSIPTGPTILAETDQTLARPCRSRLDC